MIRHDLWCTRDGLLIDFWKRECVSICVHIWTAAVEAGNMRPYGGELPFGILLTDGREHVKDKIGLTPESYVLPGSQERPNDCWRDEYHVGEHKYSFVANNLLSKTNCIRADNSLCLRSKDSWFLYRGKLGQIAPIYFGTNIFLVDICTEGILVQNVLGFFSQ